MVKLNSRRENCAECKFHNLFWGGSGCNLLNNGERCRFDLKKAIVIEADICDTCAFEDACPSAHFHPTGKNICADHKTIKKKGDDNG